METADVRTLRHEGERIERLLDELRAEVGAGHARQRPAHGAHGGEHGRQVKSTARSRWRADREPKKETSNS
jgi:hypothetical protein